MVNGILLQTPIRVANVLIHIPRKADGLSTGAWDSPTESPGRG